MSKQKKKQQLKLKRIADSGESIVDLSKRETIVGKKYTIFKRDQLNADSKLFEAYRKVKNLEFVTERPIVDIKLKRFTKLFRSAKQTRPSFGSNESYLNTFSSCKFPKGKMLVILPKSIWVPLRTKINRYVKDVAKEGYFATVYTVENAMATNIKQLIKSKSPKGVLLVGNVAPVFYEHEGGKFPCDLYYMDTNGIWQAQGDANTFKNHGGNVKPEIWLGRLFTPTMQGDDVDMIKEYLDRNHQFRTGQKLHLRDALAFVDDDWSGYPKKIKKAWDGLPSSFQSHINAAVKWPSNNKIYLFKGDKYVRYDTGEGEMDAGYPKSISAAWRGFPASFTNNIDAAVGWPNKNRLYFFKGDEYIRYDTSKNRVDPGYPKKISAGWSTLPRSFHSNIDAAVLWPNGKIYFFKGSNYVRYDAGRNRVDAGYPKPIAGNWNGFTSEFHNKVSAAVMFPNEYSYYFSDNMYIKYNTTTFKVSKGFDDCAMDEMFPKANIKTYTSPNETRADVYKQELLQTRSWVQVCVHSSPTHHGFHATPSGGSLNSNYLKNTQPPKANFYNLFSCGPGRFTTNNYLAGWYIFDKQGGGQCEGLTAIASGKSGSMLSFEDFYKPLGEGKDIGAAYKEWWVGRGNNHEDWQIKWFYGLTLLGDPTLTWIKSCIPIPSLPVNNEVFNHFPRNLKMQWQPVNLPSVKYDVEVDAKGALVGGKWAAASCKRWHIKTRISGTSYNHVFVGAQPGRWRVRSRFGNQVSPWSEWQYFRFTR